MERIERIRDFLNDYTSKTPYLRNLMRTIAAEYRKELYRYDYHRRTTIVGETKARTGGAEEAQTTAG